MPCPYSPDTAMLPGHGNAPRTRQCSPDTAMPWPYGEETAMPWPYGEETAMPCPYGEETAMPCPYFS